MLFTEKEFVKKDIKKCEKVLGKKLPDELLTAYNKYFTDDNVGLFPSKENPTLMILQPKLITYFYRGKGTFKDYLDINFYRSYDGIVFAMYTPDLMINLRDDGVYYRNLKIFNSIEDMSKIKTSEEMYSKILNGKKPHTVEEFDFYLRNRPVSEKFPFDHNIIFRFYPLDSTVHGFGDYCPKKWRDVYKVYYRWEILKQSKIYNLENKSVELGGLNSLYEENFDECSSIVDLPEILQDFMNSSADHKEVMNLGDGTDWNLTKFDNDDLRDLYTGKQKFKYKQFIKFELWQTYTDKGFRFELEYKEVKKFIQFLKKVNKYMLEHSQPI